MAAESLLGASYRVLAHEYEDDEFVKVTTRCIGYPSHGTQPVEWSFALKVPKAEVVNWPLGKLVRLEVNRG